MLFKSFKNLLFRNFHQILFRKAHTDVVHVKNGIPKTRTKSKKPPFMKNLVFGIVDKDILYFPEVEGSEENVSEEKLLQLPTKTIVGEETQFLRVLRSGICRVGFPEVYGGIPSHSTYLLRDAERLDISPLTSFLLETQCSVIETILKYGSDIQKDLYLKDLTSGLITGAFAIHEEGAGSDPPSLQCTAEQKEFSQNSSYILNGKKTWITNASTAKFFIVFAQCKDPNRTSVPALLSAFIVEKDTPGVYIEKLDFAAAECNVYNLNFDNVEIPSHSLLGNIGDGYTISVTNLESCKFIFLASILNLLRKLLSLITVQVSQTTRYPLPLRECELVQYSLSKATTILYALESSVYLLAGMKDSYEIDTSLESVIVQNLVYTYGMDVIKECNNVAGLRAFDGTNPLQSMINNLPLVLRSFISPDMLKFYVSLKSIEYGSKIMSDIVKQLRNPLNYPGFIFKRMLYSRGQATDSPKLDKLLYMEYHPSLKSNVDQLEYCISRLQYCLETFLAHHGTESVHRQIDLVRLSNIISDIFAMIAVLGRASRSYCTGIRHSDQELLAAGTWCQDSIKKVRMNVSDIVEGKVSLSDVSFLKLAPYILHHKGYFFRNPIEKNIH